MRVNDPTPEGTPGPPADPRPAWERIASAWLAREVDAGQPVTAVQLAAETSVTLAYAGDLLRVLRARRGRDPELSELRGRLVADRLTDLYVVREMHGDERLDPAALAAELGTTSTVARQWLHTLRAQQASEQSMGALMEPVSHGRPTAEQLTGLQAHFAHGGHQRAAVTGRPVAAAQVAAEVERAYWTREARASERLYALRLARELGAEPHVIAAQLRELRAGPTTARERIEQLWQAHQHDPGSRPYSSSQLAYQLGVTDAYVRHVTWQLRTGNGIAPLAERLAASREQFTTPPRPAVPVDGERDWRQDAACRDADPELFFPDHGQLPQTARAKEVCAGCAVRGPCLDNALHGPLARDDRHGIFAGTTARDRVALRGRPAMAQGTRFLQDRAAAEQAWALANRVSLDRAARELGVSKPALRRAFDHHGLGQPTVFHGGPPRSPFLHDRDAAEQAWRRAAAVGINQTRKELGTSDKALGAPRPRPAPPPHHPPAGDRPARPGVHGAQPRHPAGPGGLGRGAVRPGPGRRAAGGPGRGGGGGAQHRKPLPPARPGGRDHPPRPARPIAGSPTRTPRPAPQRRAGGAGRAWPAPPPFPAPGTGGAARWPMSCSTGTVLRPLQGEMRTTNAQWQYLSLLSLRPLQGEMRTWAVGGYARWEYALRPLQGEMRTNGLIAYWVTELMLRPLQGEMRTPQGNRPPAGTQGVATPPRGDEDPRGR
jgi:WhiB family transcriptional regulator, redox-sensing transcriptional regulator